VSDRIRDRRTGLAGSELLARFGGLAVFAAMIAFFSIDAPDTFPTLDNARTILDQAALLLILGAGLTVVLIIGQFDLSFAATIGLTGAVSAIASAQWDSPAWLAVLLAIGVGALVGVANGLAVAYGKAPAFIVTLAAGSVVTGLERLLTSDNPVTDLRIDYLELTTRRILTLSSATIVALLLVAVVWVLVRYTTYGRAIKAIGSNATAARLAGLTVQRSTVYGFMLMGACAGLASVIIVSRASQHFPDSGSGLLLAPYTAAFLGAAATGRGRFGPWSTLFGALFIGTLTTGLTIIDSPPWLTVFVQGLVLLVAVLVTRREQS